MHARPAPFVVATMLGMALLVSSTPPAGASGVTPPPGAQVFSPPASIASDCSQDVTKSLYDWINTLPQGSPSAPTDVQFASGGCYQVDGMLFLRGLTDFIFDGQGAVFKQSRRVNNALGSDLPPRRPAYCGYPKKFTDPTGSIPTGFDIMWFVEGGCDLVFQNITVVGTNSKGKPGGSSQQDSAIQVNGAQRVLLTGDTVSGVFGDFVTVTGLHEANFGGINFPAFDVTVKNNTFNHSGRQGISVVYGDRITITGNTVASVPATAIDLEAEVGGGVEGNIDISGNLFHGYAYLLSAVTFSQLFAVAFVNNDVSAMKIVVNTQSKFPGHDLTIGSNRASTVTHWSNPYDVLLANEVTGKVTSNVLSLRPPTPYFVSATGGSGLISVENNTLNPGQGAKKKFLPLPLSAPSDTVATACGDATSSGALLDSRIVPANLAQCVDVSPQQPTDATLPSFVPQSGAFIANRSTVPVATAASPSDAQPGKVSCSQLSGTVTFDPPLIDGGTSPEVVLAQISLSGCTGSDGAASPASGEGSVSLVSSSNDCASLESGGEAISTPLAVAWSPSTLGSSAVVFPGFSLASAAGIGFNLGGAGTAVGGSYPDQDGGASSTATGSSSSAPGDIATACASDDGLSSLTIDSGSLNLQ